MLQQTLLMVVVEDAGWSGSLVVGCLVLHRAYGSVSLLPVIPTSSAKMHSQSKPRRRWDRRAAPSRPTPPHGYWTLADLCGLMKLKVDLKGMTYLEGNYSYRKVNINHHNCAYIHAPAESNVRNKQHLACEWPFQASEGDMKRRPL